MAQQAQEKKTYRNTVEDFDEINVRKTSRSKTVRVKKRTKQTSAKRKTDPKDTRRIWFRRGAEVLAAAALGFGLRTGYRNSLYFLEDIPGSRNTLQMDDYIMRDADGEKVNTLVSSFGDYQNYSFYYNTDDGVMTSRGIGLGDSWQEFVDAYGDTHPEYVSLSEYSRSSGGYYYYTGEGSHLSSDDFGDMTLREIDEKYITGAELDPETYDINVSYRGYYRGSKFYSDPDEYWDVYWDESTGIMGRDGSLEMNFDFNPNGGSEKDQKGLTYINISKYVYDD